jgi:hypothetical protein
MRGNARAHGLVDHLRCGRFSAAKATTTEAKVIVYGE